MKNDQRHLLVPDTNDWKYENPWSCSCGWTGDISDVMDHANKFDNALIDVSFVLTKLGELD